MDRLGETIAAELQRMTRERDRWRQRALNLEKSRRTWRVRAERLRSANAVRCGRYRDRQAA